MCVKDPVRRVAVLLASAALLCSTALAVSSGEMISVALEEIGYVDLEGAVSLLSLDMEWAEDLSAVELLSLQ